MLKYDQQLTELKSRFPGANRNLVVLPPNLNPDNLAAGLALYLSLKSAGKQADIVSNGTPLVAQGNLYGIGDVKNEIPKSGAGNYVISLDGVVDNTGTMQQVPALEKLDWYPEGTKLNLIFHVVPGQRFEPTNVITRHEQSGYDLTWVIGCQSLNELGNLFISNSQYFPQSQVINIDINPVNGYYGFTNVIDPQASSLSEVVANILPSIALGMDRDIASNIISGIYGATNNLTTKVNPDTFIAVSQAVSAGGTLSPAASQAPQATYQQPQQQPASAPVEQPAPADYSQPVAEQPVQQPMLQSSPFIVPPQDINIPIPASQPQAFPDPQAQAPAPQFQFSQPVNQASPVPAQPLAGIPQANSQGFDLRQIFQIPQMPSGAQPASQSQAQPAPVQPQVGGNPESYHEQPPQAQVSAEERPMGEFAQSPSPEIESTPTPDWLVPKIFKGGNLG
jgi:nanoRNase/pAp phosphatase (c-di-AMP/oligoRNAs hydrolase)